MADAILTLALAFMFLAGCVVGAVLAYLDERRKLGSIHTLNASLTADTRSFVEGLRRAEERTRDWSWR